MALSTLSEDAVEALQSTSGVQRERREGKEGREGRGRRGGEGRGIRGKGIKGRKGKEWEGEDIVLCVENRYICIAALASVACSDAVCVGMSDLFCACLLQSNCRGSQDSEAKSASNKLVQ